MEIRRSNFRIWWIFNQIFFNFILLDDSYVGEDWYKTAYIQVENTGNLMEISRLLVEVEEKRKFIENKDSMDIIVDTFCMNVKSAQTRKLLKQIDGKFRKKSEQIPNQEEKELFQLVENYQKWKSEVDRVAVRHFSEISILSNRLRVLLEKERDILDSNKKYLDDGIAMGTTLVEIIESKFKEMENEEKKIEENSLKIPKGSHSFEDQIAEKSHEIFTLNMKLIEKEADLKKSKLFQTPR